MALKKMTAQGIGASQAVKDRIERYKTFAPKNNAAFNEHFKRLFPECPDAQNPKKCPGDSNYGVGWYNLWLDVFSEIHAGEIQDQIDNVLNSYYP